MLALDLERVRHTLLPSSNAHPRIIGCCHPAMPIPRKSPDERGVHAAQVLVFSYSCKMLDFIQAMTDMDGYASCRLDGSTHQKDRQVGPCWKPS